MIPAVQIETRLLRYVQLVPDGRAIVIARSQTKFRQLLLIKNYFPFCEERVRMFISLGALGQ